MQTTEETLDEMRESSRRNTLELGFIRGLCTAASLAFARGNHILGAELTRLINSHDSDALAHLESEERNPKALEIINVERK